MSSYAPFELLLVTEDFPPMPFYGGVAAFLEGLARSTTLDVRVLSPWSPGCEGVDAGQPFPVRRLRLRRRLGLAQFLVEIRRLRPKGGRGVTLFGHFSTVFVAAALVLRPRPLTVLIHGNDLYQALLRGPVWRRAAIAALRQCDLVLANSSFNRDRLLELGLPASRVEVLHPGASLPNEPPQEASKRIRSHYGLEQRRILLTVGRLVRRKNHQAVIRAVSALAEECPDLVYAIVGDGPERGALEAETRDLGLMGRVLFTGALPDSEVAAWYAACDVFVLPARWIPEEGDVEGFGIVFAEASSWGKPVIGGASGGIPDAVRNEETGLLVPPESEEALQTALRRLLAHPEERERMGIAGRLFVEKELTWPRVSDRFDRLLTNLVAQKKAR
ncbi:MAG: glycosyltransferase family 4 protein [Chloroflexi bacterium]|nr:glycosyltransferase family 4 protein [Chloroflexota bacterium]